MQYASGHSTRTEYVDMGSEFIKQIPSDKEGFEAVRIKCPTYLPEEEICKGCKKKDISIKREFSDDIVKKIIVRYNGFTDDFFGCGLRFEIRKNEKNEYIIARGELVTTTFKAVM